MTKFQIFQTFLEEKANDIVANRWDLEKNRKACLELFSFLHNNISLEELSLFAEQYKDKSIMIEIITIKPSEVLLKESKDYFLDTTNHIVNFKNFNNTIIIYAPIVNFLIMSMVNFDPEESIKTQDIETRLDYLDILLKFIPDINGKLCRYSNSVLEFAISNCSLKLIKFLIEKKQAKPELVIEYATPLLFPYFIDQETTRSSEEEHQKNQYISIIKYLVTKINIQTITFENLELILDCFQKYSFEIALNEITAHDYIILCIAISQGKIHLVQKFIDLGVDFFSLLFSTSQISLLHIAVQYEQIQSIEFLVNLNSNFLDILDNEKYTPILYAVKLGKEASLIKLVELHPVFERTNIIFKNQGKAQQLFQFLLREAATRGNITMINALINLGADVKSFYDRNGFLTPSVSVTHASALYPSHYPNPIQSSPMYFAAKEGHIEVIEALKSFVPIPSDMLFWLVSCCPDVPSNIVSYLVINSNPTNLHNTLRFAFSCNKVFVIQTLLEYGESLDPFSKFSYPHI